ncbi:hypothetical protein SDC9_88463 [bioreactor metagenome]|uniref:Uncharacterized protein n=1 Tax=bioreactor metagenome TaxID=1076179 RepID=A0A644ZW64_9ZZZZ
MSAQQIGQHLAAALVGNVAQPRDAGALHEQLGRHVRDVAVASRAVGDGVALVVDVGDELFDVLHRQLGVDDQYQRGRTNVADGREIAQRIVGHFLRQHGADGLAGGHAQQQRVAVGGCACHLGCRDHAVRARLVFHDDTGVERLPQMLRHLARDKVCTAAGWKAHQQPDGLGRITLVRQGGVGPGARSCGDGGSRGARKPAAAAPWCG